MTEPLTHATSHRSTRGSARRLPWRWVLGAALAVSLILGGAFAARVVIGSARLDVTVPAPALGPLRLEVVTPPGISFERIALDSATGHLVALTGPAAQGCPPTGACASFGRPDAFVVLDGATGAALARTPLSGDAASAASAALLVVEADSHAAYAVSSTAIARFSTLDGTLQRRVTLGTALAGPPSGGALDPTTGHLYLCAGSTVYAFDVNSGMLLASQPILHGAGVVDGPAFDPSVRRLYLLARGSGGPPQLAAFAPDLAPLGQLPLPENASLGPLDTAGRTLYLFGQGGAVYQLTTDAPFSVAALSTAPRLRNATALGWNPDIGHTYRATAGGLDLLELASGRPLATLPLPVVQPAATPLLTDGARGLLYVPTLHGQLAIVHDAGAASAGALNPATALLLARTALGHFLPDTNQDPPFIAQDTFPLDLTAAPSYTPLSHDYWIHFSDLGWQGPYPGTADATINRDPGRAGGYLATFRIAWQQLFLRQHQWVCAIAPDGTVTLRSEGGDAVP
ncbi:MAG TPA: hypothetical protein VFU88_13825 [Ktedonobacterales bacterium]|nr:hypothetical protein [Ktedonobacterales bacterium]